MFFGEHPHSIDSKGRLIISSKLRSPLKEFCIDQFVVTRGFDKCLYMFAPSEWHQIDKKFRSLKLLTKSKSRALQRLFFSGTAIVDCDKQGRVLIPKNLLEYAGIVKDVMVVGLSSRIEIWALEGWVKEYDGLKESYSDLAEELMDFDIS